jgi:putative DNA-invertase from lambdoid prophage Rac
MALLIDKPERMSMTNVANGSASQPDQAIENEGARSMHRTSTSRAVAQAAAPDAGKTAKGKDAMGRPQRANASEVSAWKKANKATVAETAKHFNLPPTIAKRYCAVA